MKKIFISVIIFLAGLCSVFAQPYDTPPFLSTSVVSSGSFDLEGKKYYLTDWHFP